MSDIAKQLDDVTCRATAQAETVRVLAGDVRRYQRALEQIASHPVNCGERMTEIAREALR